jgi:hypothetical protein
MAAVVPDVYTILETKWTELGATANLTKRTLTLGLQDGITGWYGKTFAETTVQGFIIPKGLRQILTLPGISIRYDAICITKTAFEGGDEITDAAGNIWAVEDRLDHYFLDTLGFYEVQLTLKTELTGTPSKWDGVEDFFTKLINQLESHGLSADLTLFTLALTTLRDTVTGWYTSYYTHSTIKGVLIPKGSSIQYARPAIIPTQTATLYALADVFEGDIVQDATGVQWVIVTRTMNFLANKLALYTCVLEKRVVTLTINDVEHGFEDGTFGPLDEGSLGCGGSDPYIDTSDPYSGTRHAVLPPESYVYHGVTLPASFVRAWSFKAKCASGTETLHITIIYSDYTETNYTQALTTTYQEIEFVSHLDKTKTVISLELDATGTSSLCLIDEYQLVYAG